jgi:hypothetical protein
VLSVVLVGPLLGALLELAQVRVGVLLLVPVLVLLLALVP